jgi:hypothetical protein
MEAHFLVGSRKHSGAFSFAKTKPARVSAPTSLPSPTTASLAKKITARDLFEKALQLRSLNFHA